MEGVVGRSRYSGGRRQWGARRRLGLGPGHVGVMRFLGLLGALGVQFPAMSGGALFLLHGGLGDEVSLWHLVFWGGGGLLLFLDGSGLHGDEFGPIVLFHRQGGLDSRGPGISVIQRG